MHVRLTSGKVRRGAWAEYERAYETVLADRQVDGLIVRYLIQSTDDPDEGWSLTVWQDAAAATAYETGPLFGEVTTSLRPYSLNDYNTRHGNVRYRDELRTKRPGERDTK
jgi:heme-degrading monooxygenase HmoA